MSDSQIVLVSGGSRGLGQGIVENLLNAGHTVYTFSRNSTPFVESLRAGKFADKFNWEAIDGTDYSRVESYVSQIFEKSGRIDSLINNAGVAVEGVLTLMPTDDISKVMALNLEGVIRLSRACVKYMLVKKHGSIVNISSIIGSRGYAGLSVYGATKAGLDGFTRGLAREVGARGIRVNSVAPGYLETEMSSKLDAEQVKQIVRRTPLGRLGKVDDVTGLVKFLISPESKYVTGQTIVVDGGITC